MTSVELINDNNGIKRLAARLIDARLELLLDRSFASSLGNALDHWKSGPALRQSFTLLLQLAE